MTEASGRSALLKDLDINLPPKSRISIKRNVAMEEHVAAENDCVLMIRSIGSFTYFGQACKLYNINTIGRYCSFGQEILIGAGPHPTDWLSTSTLFYRKRTPFKSPEISAFCEAQKVDFIESRRGVSIGNDVWIGSRAIILSDVQIGHGAVIGAGAVVTKDVEPYAIVAGVPARTLRHRFDAATIARLLQSSWWTVKPLLLKGMDYSNVLAMLDKIDCIKTSTDWRYRPRTVVIPAD